MLNLLLPNLLLNIYLMKVLIILADDEASVYYLFYLCIMC